MNYLLHLCIYLSIYSVLALSLNLIMGYMGRLSLAHAGFMAVGSYTYALATTSLGWSFLPALVGAISIGVALSLLLSLPSWRFSGDFFIMITLVVQTLIYEVIFNWHSPFEPVGSWTNMTNGPFGIAGIAKPDILGIKLDTIGGVSALTISFACLCLWVIFRLTQSPWGRLLKGIRDDELALRSLGKNVRLLKVQAFAFSSGLAAIAGVLYAAYIGFIDPSVASLDESILWLCMLCVGGMGNFRGALVGAFVLLALPELIKFVPFPASLAANVRLLAYGLLLIFFAHFRPQGIAGEYRIE